MCFHHYLHKITIGDFGITQQELETFGAILEFSLNVFTEFAEFSDKNIVLF